MKKAYKLFKKLDFDVQCAIGIFLFYMTLYLVIGILENMLGCSF